MIWLRKWWMWIAGAAAGVLVLLRAVASGRRQERAKQLDKKADDLDDQADAIEAKQPELDRRAAAATERRKEVEADVEAEREARRTDDRDGGDRMDDAFRD